MYADAWPIVVFTRSAPARACVASAVPTDQENRSLAGRQASGIASHENCCGQGRGGQGVASRRSPRGYHTASRGQSQTTPVAVPPRAAPGMPRGPVAPSRRDTTRAPACKIIGNPRHYIEARSPPRDRRDAGTRLGVTEKQGQFPPTRADDSGDDNAGNWATAAHREPGVATQIEGRRQGLHAPGGQVCSCPGHHAGRAGLPPGDRSFDRNEQHRAALGHHPANAACPRRAGPIPDVPASVNRRVVGSSPTRGANPQVRSP